MKKFCILLTLTALALFSCSNEADSETESTADAGTQKTEQSNQNDESETQDDTKESTEEKKDTDSQGAHSESFTLDFSETASYSMKVGENVELARFFAGEYDFYIDNINDISDYIEESSNENFSKVLTAKSVGTVTVKATDWNDSKRSWYCTITITADGFSGTSIEYKLLGTWKYTGSSSNGILILNADKTGHITTYLNGGKIHDSDFSWQAYETKNRSNTYPILSISGTNISTLDGTHQLKNVRAGRFTLNGYLAFGMPNETTWTRQ